MKKINILLVCTLLVITLISILPSTLMYLTNADIANNNTSMGYNQVTIVENFPDPPKLTAGVNEYTKGIKVQNTGTTEAFVRVRIAFSSKEAKDATTFKGSGGRYYDIDNLTVTPPLWKKTNNNELKKYGDYFYFTQILKPGVVSPSLTSVVRTYFENADDVVPYDIYVYAESIQVYDKDGNKYSSNQYEAAWLEYLKRK